MCTSKVLGVEFTCVCVGGGGTWGCKFMRRPYDKKCNIHTDRILSTIVATLSISVSCIQMITQPNYRNRLYVP